MKIFDGHNDVLLKLHLGLRAEASFLERSEEGQLDFVRAKEGGFVGGFFAVFAPTPNFDLEPLLEETPDGYRFPMVPPVDRATALEHLFGMAAQLFRAERLSKGTFKVVRSIKDLEHCLNNDIMAAIFHIEGAEAIDTSLETLELLYAAGLRSLGPVWSRQNSFGSGVPFTFPSSPDTGDGLTPDGKRLVERCNDLGVMLDLSHITERGFWDVAKLSDAPLVATHSNVHALSSSARNLTDKQLAAIAESDGMVGLNFAVAFLREDGRPVLDTPLDILVKHMDYLIDKLGEDRVGLGSDFDGARIPEAIGDVRGLPKLVEAFKAHGYNDELLAKLGYKNWLRVLAKTWN